MDFIFPLLSFVRRYWDNRANKDASSGGDFAPELEKDLRRI